MKTKSITKIAVLGAIAFILMLLDFPVPFAPPFYRLDFSEVVVLVGGFALGPFAAIVIEALKIVLNLMFHGSITAGVGEFANFLIGISFVVPASIVYQKNKTRAQAKRGLWIGGLSMVVVGLILNYFVLLPAYSYFLKMPMDVILSMGKAIVPIIDSKLTFVILATTPFNLVKAIIISVVTVHLYKHVSPLLHK